jgi:hypothetical protein
MDRLIATSLALLVVQSNGGNRASGHVLRRLVGKDWCFWDEALNGCSTWAVGRHMWGDRLRDVAPTLLVASLYSQYSFGRP